MENYLLIIKKENMKILNGKVMSNHNQNNLTKTTMQNHNRSTHAFISFMTSINNGEFVSGSSYISYINTIAKILNMTLQGFITSPLLQLKISRVQIQDKPMFQRLSKSNRQDIMSAYNGFISYSRSLEGYTN